MSIASEITALQTNLTAAKTAVTTKGGTVTDSGLAGLASEIASIPSGGSLANYGSITYLDENNVSQTLTLLTIDDFLELCTPAFDTAIMKINQHDVVKSKVTNVTIADGVTFLPDYFGYCFSNVSNTVTLPSTIIAIGIYFMGSGHVGNTLNLQNVKMVGPNFLSSSNYNNALNLPSIEFIDQSFMSSCPISNAPITLNDACRYIGDNFLSGCNSFAQPLSIPSGLEDIVATGSYNPGGGFMKNCNAFTGPLVCNAPANANIIPQGTGVLSTSNASAAMYVTGVTLTGPYAQAWKDALPDRTTSPYRKLIVGE